MSLCGSSCQPEHLCIFSLDLSRLVVADDDCAVGVSPGDCSFIELQTTASQVGNVYALVVLLVYSLKYDLLLLVINFNDIVVLSPRHVSYTPFESLSRVLSNEDGVHVRSLH